MSSSAPKNGGVYKKGLYPDIWVSGYPGCSKRQDIDIMNKSVKNNIIQGRAVLSPKNGWLQKGIISGYLEGGNNVSCFCGEGASTLLTPWMVSSSTQQNAKDSVNIFENILHQNCINITYQICVLNLITYPQNVWWHVHVFTQLFINAHIIHWRIMSSLRA